MHVAIDHVPIADEPEGCASRGCSRRCGPTSDATASRSSAIYALYEPLKVFMTAALRRRVAAVIVWGRFVYFYIDGAGAGHVQSLILGAVLFNAATVLAALGVIGDLLSGQRITLQRIFERVRRVELELGVPPSHYEPGAPSWRSPTTGAAARPRRDRGPRGSGQAMSGTVTRDAEGTVTGNTYDKYGSKPGRPAADGDLPAHARTSCSSGRAPSLLDVGCGEAS